MCVLKGFSVFSNESMYCRPNCRGEKIEQARPLAEREYSSFHSDFEMEISLA